MAKIKRLKNSDELPSWVKQVRDDFDDMRRDKDEFTSLELAAQLGLSRATAARRLDEYVSHGLYMRRRGIEKGKATFFYRKVVR